jgi:hypothetical protein
MLYTLACVIGVKPYASRGDSIFVHDKWKITNSPQRMAKQHQTTLRFETYLVSKFANVI